MQEKTKILIFSEINTPRFRYILNWILGERLGLDFTFTNDVAYWKNFSGLKLNYSTESLVEKEIKIIPATLLQSDEIKIQQLNINRWKHSTVLFYNQPAAKIPFDIFSAAFYLISRYEEYLPHQKDRHGRYLPEQSVAGQYSFLQQPVVDEWLLHFKQILEQHFNIKISFSTFEFRPTYDIDIAWKYAHKGLKRYWAGILKDLLLFKWYKIAERFQIQYGKRKDPFDAFKWLDDIHKAYHLQPIYFMLLGKLSAYDKNADPNLPAMQSLMKDLFDKYEVGIHPSYLSNEDSKQLSKEIKSLALAGKKIITKSRQHYIKLSMPQTYERLIKEGIQDDYSMGYASVNGFRASTSHTFKWYHLNQERETNLNIHPFAFMEATNKFYLKQSPQETWLEWERLWHAVKGTQGTFISIWHNYTLGTDKESRGWRDLYLKCLSQL